MGVLKKTMSFEDRALKYLKHTLYCKWERRGGWYGKGNPCTCGRDDFFREIVALRNENERLQQELYNMENNEAWRLESLASDERIRDE